MKCIQEPRVMGSDIQIHSCYDNIASSQNTSDPIKIPPQPAPHTLLPWSLGAWGWEQCSGLSCVILMREIVNFCHSLSPAARVADTLTQIQDLHCTGTGYNAVYSALHCTEYTIYCIYTVCNAVMQ